MLPPPPPPVLAIHRVEVPVEERICPFVPRLPNESTRPPCTVVVPVTVSVLVVITGDVSDVVNVVAPLRTAPWSVGLRNV